MNPVFHRVCLIVLAVTGLFVGLWAYFASSSWYETFPGLGLRWLPVLGPFNEHLIKDVGAMYLALTALSVFALVNLANRQLRLATAVGYSVFNLLHLVYHATMLHMYGPRDAVLNMIALGLVLVCSLALAVPVKVEEESMAA